MDSLSWNVVFLAFTVAVLHTALGPDHYLPFVMLAKARRWTTARTMAVTAACGIGHVLSSLVLGLAGVCFGVAVGSLETLEGHRGSIAAWALVAFGVAYVLWGLRRAYRHKRGLLVHEHGHSHVHLHAGGDHPHPHSHGSKEGKSFWALFLIFVLGPCEPLIPLFILPVSQGRWALAAVAALVFCLATLATMLGITLAVRAGLERLPLGRLERWMHPLSGAVIAASGLAVVYGL